MAVFAVDNVAPVLDRLPSRRLADVTGEALAIGGDPDLPLLEPDGVHPLLSAVGRAFAEHRPLVLSPDAVWLTIAQGMAQHIRLHAEELRPRLVNHSGRKRLEVTVNGPMPADADSWARATEHFAKLLADEIRDVAGLECDFTTSTDVERTAGRIILMDAYSPYFSYQMMCICGIPSITLTGTLEDWRRIRDRIGIIETYGLGAWCRSLRPITEQFARAAFGDVDVKFWRRIYNPADAYGGDVITGWIARFYPYLEAGGTFDVPNELLDLPIGEPKNITSKRKKGASFFGYQGPGIRSDSVPATLSKAIVDVNDAVSGDNRRVALHAGLVGVTQDDDGALCPVAGWHLSEAAADISDVIDRLIAEQRTTPPPTGRGPAAQGTAEVIALYNRVGSAELFEGAWRILPVAEHRSASVGGRYVHWPIEALIDLPDGQCLAGFEHPSTHVTHWARCRLTATEEGRIPVIPRGAVLEGDPADVPVYGTSLAMILEAALDSGGDIDHLETGRLSDLLR